MTSESNSGKEPAPFWSWADIALFVGLGLPPFIMVFSGVSFLMRLLPAKPSQGAALLIPQFAGFAAAVAPLALVFRSKYDQPLLRSLRMSVPASRIPAAIASGLALAFLVVLAGALLRTPKIESPMDDLMNDPASVPFVAIFAVTLGPWFEELVFRGLLQPVLIRSAGVIAGILLAALPFGLLHGPEYAWSWRHLLIVTLAGAAFGYTRFRSGSTGEAVVMHAAYNGVLITGYLLGRHLL